ncbi:GDP-mannose 4,6-dehydratase [Sporomusa termitida]|uniref:GDP-mannose 4,6-dehydratase n=1 Tax=Sporomusa termitida TaxID=2377 RepID=A0A517DXG5_9FIRM|nr:GDP-mannose 4,6-dehydratase [Sporomusa termitida]QDR82041.1 GDP-mannose 4,6-dehydratase [Sporomusa termitida]
MKKVLITGITGQDGSYLAALLLGKGYEVHGAVRRASMENTVKLQNIQSIADKINLHACSLDNHLSVYKLIAAIRPDECYHLAASSFVSYSFEDEASILAANFTSTHYLLSSIKELCPSCRVYFAGSSEIFGNAEESPQTETTKFNPRSMYGISKLASHHVVKNYREQYGLYACTGFTYNHESPRRGHAFVTRKITATVAKIFLGIATKIELGNIETIRDWGYAPEYVEAMWRMLHNPQGPKDYVVATGVAHTVSELLATAFSTVGLNYTQYIVINKDFYRPGEQVPLIGNAKSIYTDLGWKHTTLFKDMIVEMVQNDIREYSAQNNQ